MLWAGLGGCVLPIFWHSHLLLIRELVCVTLPLAPITNQGPSDIHLKPQFPLLLHKVLLLCVEDVVSICQTQALVPSG